MKVGKIMRKVDWSNPEEVREWHRQYNAKHNKLNYAKNKEYWKEYYLNHKENWKRSKAKKDGLWLYIIRAIDGRRNWNLYVGSTTNLSRLDRHKHCEQIRRCIDENIPYAVYGINLLDYKEDATVEELRNLEQWTINNIKPLWNDVKAVEELDRILACRLSRNLYYANMRVFKYNILDYKNKVYPIDLLEEFTLGRILMARARMEFLGGNKYE